MYNDCANTKWMSMLIHVITHGETVAPRGMVTQEMLGYQSRVNMAYPVVTNPIRKINRRFLFGEAWWILSGSNKVRDIASIMKNIENFSDDGITFYGAYGPKVIEQVGYVVDNLVNDINSRQAIINIWRERPGPSKDIPCTLSLQFLIRENKLHCIATMRSSDAWLGWVYDVFNFSMISKYILLFLRYVMPDNKRYSNLILGDLYLTASSQHLYQSNWEQALEIVNMENKPHPCKCSFNEDLEIYAHPDELIRDLKAAAYCSRENVKSFIIRDFIQ